MQNHVHMMVIIIIVFLHNYDFKVQPHIQIRKFIEFFIHAALHANYAFCFVSSFEPFDLANVFWLGQNYVAVVRSPNYTSS